MINLINLNNDIIITSIIRLSSVSCKNKKNKLTHILTVLAAIIILYYNNIMYKY